MHKPYVLLFVGSDTIDYSYYPNKDCQLQWLQMYLEEMVILKGNLQNGQHFTYSNLKQTPWGLYCTAGNFHDKKLLINPCLLYLNKILLLIHD